MCHLVLAHKLLCLPPERISQLLLPHIDTGWEEQEEREHEHDAEPNECKKQYTCFVVYAMHAFFSTYFPTMLKRLLPGVARTAVITAEARRVAVEEMAYVA